MALNKRKVLETARKHAQKGAKAKALKEYNKLLKADPRDAKLLLEVGDAYRRWGQAEEAIAQYGKVAQQYRQDGFDARAVAVFKQILNLDPKHYAAYVSLSELYQRMGLDSEAISALQTAADGYHKEGRKAEALDLLRQTAALDPTNTTSRLKVADLLRQEGMEPEAISEYRAVAEELDNQGDREHVLVVLERILEINADDIDTLMSLARHLMAAGELDRAEVFAVRALNVSTEPSQYELLMELYSQGGNEPKLAEATRGLAKLHRERGDEETARTLMQRLPVEEVGSSSRMAVDVSEVAEPRLEDDELLEEEPFLSLDEEAVSDPESMVAEAQETIDLGTEAPQPGDPVDPAPLPEGDPDQLLAEANVYLRYGKRDQAIASLRGVLAQDPVHQAALEKLGEAYEGDGQNGPAVEAWTQAATQAREAGDAEALAVLKDRITAIDPAAAEQLGSVQSVAAASEPAPSDGGIELDLDVEVDLNLDTAIGEVAGSETQSGLSVDLDLDVDASLDDDTSDSEDDEFEIELDDDAFDLDVDVDDVVVGAGVEGETPDAASASVTGGITESLSASVEDEPSLDDESVEFDFDIDELSSPGGAAASGQSTTTTAKIAEELEEAEFYLAQDMFDEAEEILSRILALVPDHPSAMLRMGELAAARGEAPDLDLAAASSDDAVVDAAELTFNGMTEGLDQTAGSDAVADVEFDADLDAGVEVTQDVKADEVASSGVAEEELVAGAPSDDERVHEIEEDVSLDGTTGATEPAEGDPEISDEATSEALVGDDTSAAESESDEPDAGASFDLREALADVLSDEDESTNSDETSGVLSTVEDGFGSIFSDFKKGVTATLEEGDFATRFDLGIAYREMGLFEDALGEFRFCLDSPERRFESLHLMGVCARDLSRFGDAVNHFEQALALPEIPSERLAGVYFDLALAEQGAGDIERACASLRQSLEAQADFPGATALLSELESASDTSPKLAQPGENFESFDELFEADDDEEGDGAMVEAVPVETYESFDDVVSEAEVIEEETASDDSDEDTQSTTKGGRKKISFV